MNIFPPPLQGYGRRRPPVPKLRRGHFICNGLTDCLLLGDGTTTQKNLIPGGTPGTMGTFGVAPNQLFAGPSSLQVAASSSITQGTVAVPTTGSLAVWFYPTWAQADGLWHTWFAVTTDAGGGDAQQFRMIKFSDNNIYCGWINGGVGNNVTVTSYSIFTNWWNLIVFTWIINSTGVVYLNGAPVGTQATMNSTWNTAGNNRSIAKYTGTSADNGFDGRFSLYQMWNRALSPAEARLLWDKPFDHFEQPASVRAAFTPPATGGRFRPAWVRPGVIIGGGVY